MTAYLLDASTYVIAMIVQASWLYAFIEIVNRKAAAAQLSVPLLLTLLPVSFLINRQLRRRHWASVLQVWLGWLIWVPAMLIMVKLQLYQATPWPDLAAWMGAFPRAFVVILEQFRPEILLLLSAPVIWWLGQRLAYLQPDFGSAVGDFQLGLIALLLTFLINAGLEVPFAPAVAVAMVFFGFGLLGIALAHAREHNGWLSGLHRPQWSGLLVMTIGIILVAGLVLGVIFTPGLLDALLAILAWSWGWFIKFMEFVASLIPPPAPSTMTPLPGGMPLGGGEESRNLFELSETARKILQILWSVLFFGIFALAIWRMSTSLMGWLRRVLAARDAELEPMPGAFKADLLSLIKGLLALIWQKLRLPRRKARTASREVLTVRQIYQQLLRWAAGLGYPRGLAQTPYEYLSGTLGRLMPEQEPFLALITESYVRARYGTAPVSDHDLAEIRDAWSRLKGHRPGKKRKVV